MDASASRRRRPRGFSLIELLVSMAIALVVTLAITTVMIQGEGSKRSTTSVNEINQTGAYVAYVLDRQLRNAGSGFTQRWGDMFGCAITASRNDGAGLMLPRGSSLPAPFANAASAPRLAPVIIVADGADTTGAGAEVRGDLVTIMGGTAGFGEMPQLVNTNSVTGASGSGSLQLPNTVGYAADQLLLLSDSGIANGCLVEHISAVGVGGLLQLGGTYYQQSGNSIALGGFGANTFAVQLGGASTNPPQFNVFGVGDQRTLYSYDLLRTAAGSDTPVPLADSVVEMRAIYGIDTTATPDGKVDSWVQPTAANGYDAATLTSGSAAAREKLRRIVAVRLGLILRTSLKEKSPIAAAQTLTLFGDVAAQRTRTLSGDEPYYRFRTLEITVPLRNVLMSPEAAS